MRDEATRLCKILWCACSLCCISPFKNCRTQLHCCPALNRRCGGPWSEQAPHRKSPFPNCLVPPTVVAAIDSLSTRAAARRFGRRRRLPCSLGSPIGGRGPRPGRPRRRYGVVQNLRKRENARRDKRDGGDVKESQPAALSGPASVLTASGVKLIAEADLRQLSSGAGPQDASRPPCGGVTWNIRRQQNVQNVLSAAVLSGPLDPCDGSSIWPSPVMVVCPRIAGFGSCSSSG